jgi:hypothetical protein
MNDLKPIHTILFYKYGERPEGYLPMKGGSNPHYQYYVSIEAE